MVIQRNCPIKIWGSGITGKSVSVKFRGDEYETTVDNKGNWLIMITGTDKITCGLIGGQQEFIFE